MQEQVVLDSPKGKRREYPEQYLKVQENVTTSDKKVRFVMYLFSDGPKEYDFLLKIMSLGRDSHWRENVIQEASARPGELVLDIACGTGLVSFELAINCKAQVIGIDVTREMLQRAVELKRRYSRIKSGGQLDVDFIQARAENLPLRNEAFAAAAISLAMRNVSSIPQTLSEMTRCVKADGKVMSMDFTRPEGAVFAQFYAFYTFNFLPTIGLLISRHWNGIFAYLARSILRSKSPEKIREMMLDAGLENVRIRRMTRGVTALTVGSKV